MKKETQARQKVSGGAVNNQTENPKNSTAITVEQYRDGIQQAISQIDAQWKDDDGLNDSGRMYLLAIRQHLSPLVGFSSPPGAGEVVKQQASHGDVGEGMFSQIARVNESILALLRQIDSKMEEDHSSDVKIEFLTIRQTVEDLQCEAAVLTNEAWKNPAQPAPSIRATVVAPITVDPFPVHEDPQHVQGPRFHIRDFYKLAEKNKHDDGFSSLINLRDCIEHHPGLKVEAEALQKLIDGHNALNELGCRHAFVTEFDKGFSGSEVWLVHLLHKIDETVTMKDFLCRLRGVTVRLRGNPATVGLAGLIDGMVEGDKTMWKLDMWLQSLF